MKYAVFEIEKSKKKALNAVLADDIISRQSIAIRDASSVGVKKDVEYVLIEGDEAAIKKAEELLAKDGCKKEPDKEAEKIYKSIKDQENSAAEGVGFIFG